MFYDKSIEAALRKRLHYEKRTLKYFMPTKQSEVLF